MADAVGVIATAVELALKIKEAVDTVRQNREDCAHVKRRVERVRHTLSLCEGNAELMESPAVRAAVEALAEVLADALELVTGCQEQGTSGAVCLCYSAGKLSKQLGNVDRGISDGNLEVTFAILVYHISKSTQTGDGGAGPAMSTHQTEEIQQQSAVDETPEQTPQSCYAGLSLAFFEGWGCRRGSPSWGGGSGDYGGDDGLFRRGRRGHGGRRGEGGGGDGGGGGGGGDGGDGGGGGGEDSGCGVDGDDYGGGGGLFHGGGRSGGGDGDGGGDNVLFQEITKVTLAIRTAIKTARRNKEECLQIDKLASRISLVVSQLEHTETKKDTVHQALKSLCKTFHHAHKLVAVCQRQSIVSCSPGKLSSELCGVLDEIMLGLDHLIDALL